LYESTKDVVLEQIKKTAAVCLTTDCWTSVNNTSFMAVTAHFLNENMEFKSHCLDCTEFSDCHTAENIGEKLKEITRTWDISYKVTAIVSDNVSNVIAGVRLTGYRHISCFAHSLNLVVQKSLKHIEPVTHKVCIVKQLIKFHHNIIILISYLRSRPLYSILNVVIMLYQSYMPHRNKWDCQCLN